ncbi:MAG: hypothetical protein CVV42_09000 [Candidatus Riflebacteria bacterium HGW-Riflebacteria-2]|nr:MAG: hypothetical protein CVV42_09000 [Candidatus Riflebacteria bacterium HGW-Riflebacteria-2]
MKRKIVVLWLLLTLAVVGEAQETAKMRAIEQSTMANAKVKTMKLMSGDRVMLEKNFDKNGKPLRQVETHWDSRLEIDYNDGKMAAGKLTSREGKVIADYIYDYDDAGNLVEQTQTSPRGTLIGKWVWEYESGELKKQSFRYIDGSPPMGDGGPAYQGHSTSIEFTCKDGLIIEEKLDAWASTADGGSYITVVNEYDSEGRRIARTVSSRPQFERADNPFKGMTTRVEFNYDEKGLLQGKKEALPKSPAGNFDLQPVRSKTSEIAAGGNKYLYEFYP